MPVERGAADCWIHYSERPSGSCSLQQLSSCRVAAGQADLTVCAEQLVAFMPTTATRAMRTDPVQTHTSSI